MGNPLRGWYRHAELDSGYFSNISGMIPVMDPSYVEDFWSKPGYLGTDPESAIGKDRFQLDSTVASVTGGPPWLVEVDSVPDRDCIDAHLVVLSGAAAGATLPIAATEGKVIRLIAVLDPAVVGALKPGDQVRIDNSWALALQTYHRHQVPPTEDYYGWKQFRDASGKPIYPQRAVLIGPTGTKNAAGSVFSGRSNGKVLMLSALMDLDAFPWQADWYRSRAKSALGAAFDDNFALWFVDHAHHENPLTPLQRAHVVSFGGALQQALRDLATWVEQGVKPSETVYEVIDTQVEVPTNAAERKGIQPVISLQANGGVRAEVKAGEAVTFFGAIEVPPGAGKVVAAEWDFEGSGDFADKAPVGTPQERVTLSATHAYAKPGTYYAVLRGTSQREGDARTPYGRVQNLAQVRVVVS